MIEKMYRITGMHCAACSTGIEKFLSRQPGIASVNVNLITEKMTVDFDEETISSNDIVELVQKIMYGCEEYVPASSVSATQRSRDRIKIQNELAIQRRNVIVASCFAVPLIYISMLHMIGAPLPSLFDEYPVVLAIFQMLLAIPILIAGRKFYASGFPSLCHGRPNMDSLIAVGTSAAFIFSVYLTIRIILGQTELVYSLCFESSAVVVAIVMIGKYLETKSKRRTSEAINRLTELSPEKAHVTRYGETGEIPTEELRPGDIVTVFPGERFPCDGDVVSGISAVDLSMLTGESRPVSISEGSGVVGGSINLDGMVTFTATKTGEQTNLSHIIRMVEDAQAKKAPIAKLADKVAGVFVPTVILIAVISSICWAISGKPFDFVLKVFVSVLVIACPCSLGLATPTAIMAGTGRGAEMQILFKSGEALQTLASIDTVVLDKTGTVTEGKLVLEGIFPEAGYDSEKLLQYCAAAEVGSHHPIAFAIITEAEKRRIAIPSSENVSVIPGRGISATVDNKNVLCGNSLLMVENKIPYNVCEQEEATIFYLAVDGVCWGCIAARDQIKSDSAITIEELDRLGISSVMMTGDNDSTARKISMEAGIKVYLAEVLPEGKASKIETMRINGARIAMVGDGINDAPALVAADVGIAIGTGTDVAIESADIVLMSGALKEIPTAIRLSKAVIRVIRQNLFWAFFYNCCGIPFAAGVVFAMGGPLLHPMFAGACMAVSSITVVSNALRLKRFK